MEEENKNTKSETKEAVPKKLSPIAIGVIAILVIATIAVVVFLVFRNKGNLNTESPIVEGTTASEIKTETDIQTIAIEGGMYYFKPNEIRVKKGEKVKIILTSKEGTHDFIVDEFNASTKRVSTGQSAEVEFTADKVEPLSFTAALAATEPWE